MHIFYVLRLATWYGIFGMWVDKLNYTNIYIYIYIIHINYMF